MERSIENLVVADAEDAVSHRDDGQTRHLRQEESRGQIISCAVNPCLLGTVKRKVYPGILDLCHSMGKVMGVAPTIPKSNELCLYFHMYSD